ncbi:DUF4168 domain-containing protein [Acidithiobacillus sp.]|uniref:DUF4168 domain-containing protein n=1 Tax=Acidithiobacillus sp. TaxID=1872118 RepID=UPI00338ECFCD
MKHIARNLLLGLGVFSLGSTLTQHRRLVAKYGTKIRHVLVQNHLTPVRYEMLLKKAQTDPMFAQRTETVMKSMG